MSRETSFPKDLITSLNSFAWALNFAEMLPDDLDRTIHDAIMARSGQSHGTATGVRTLCVWARTVHVNMRGCRSRSISELECAEADVRHPCRGALQPPGGAGAPEGCGPVGAGPAPRPAGASAASAARGRGAFRRYARLRARRACGAVGLSAGQSSASALALRSVSRSTSPSTGDQGGPLMRARAAVLNLNRSRSDDH